MAPLEDRSQLSINMTTPEGSTYEFNAAYTEDVAALVERTVPERDKVTTMIVGGHAYVRIVLVPPSERKRTQKEIANQLTRRTAKDDKSKGKCYSAINFWWKTCRASNSVCTSSPNYR